MHKKILLFPFGGNAREALATIVAINNIHREWDVVGFVDDDKANKGKELYGVKVLGGREIFKQYPEALVLAVPGNPQTFSKRDAIIKDLGIASTRFAQVIHPSVIVAPDAKIGYNTVIMPHVVLSCGVTVGNHCVILPNSTIAHDSSVGDFTLIGSNVSVAGFVTIGKSCYLGTGSCLRDHISVGNKVLIGMGSIVVKSVEDNVTVAGNPAKPLRKK